MDVTKNIARGRGVTLWRQIADTLRAEVETGVLKPGEQLPTEPELAERFSVNRHTVRRAMAVLAERGLLTVEQGRGTFVRSSAIPYVLGRRTRFSANVYAQGRGPGHHLVAAQVGTAMAHVAAELGIAEGAPTIRLETLSAADGTPLTFGVHTFPLPRFAGLDDGYRRLGPMTHALAELGVADYTRRVTRLIARMPTAAEATHLGQSIDRPVLQAESINVDADGIPIQHSFVVFAGDRVQMIVQPDEDDAAART